MKTRYYNIRLNGELLMQIHATSAINASKRAFETLVKEGRRIHRNDLTVQLTIHGN